MPRNLLRDMGRSFVILALFTLLCGVLYPLGVTGFAQVFFPRQARGSLILRNGRITGSALLGQKVSDARYFQPRPSATGWNTLASGGSNAGPISAALRDSVAARRARWSAGVLDAPPSVVPPDLLTASASGLDPHISPEAARYQIPHVAAARGLTAAQTQELELLVARAVEEPQVFVLGEPRVNVTMLNHALDGTFDR
jgi:potassium-transporting ATPase KdpC subunit